jgi:hypothetical protein
MRFPNSNPHADIDWISPIATLVFRTTPPEKQFPARGTLQKLDPRMTRYERLGRDSAGA